MDRAARRPRRSPVRPRAPQPLTEEQDAARSFILDVVNHPVWAARIAPVLRARRDALARRTMESPRVSEEEYRRNQVEWQILSGLLNDPLAFFTKRE